MKDAWLARAQPGKQDFTVVEETQSASPFYRNVRYNRTFDPHEAARKTFGRSLSLTPESCWQEANSDSSQHAPTLPKRTIQRESNSIKFNVRHDRGRADGSPLVAALPRPPVHVMVRWCFCSGERVTIATNRYRKSSERIITRQIHPRIIQHGSCLFVCFVSFAVEP